MYQLNDQTMTLSQKLAILRNHGIETRRNNGTIEVKDEYSYQGRLGFTWVDIEGLSIPEFLGY